MFIFRRPIAGPLVALTLLAVLVVINALFDVSSTFGTKVSGFSSGEATMPAPLESTAQRLAGVSNN
jgi:hypothetical protein